MAKKHPKLIVEFIILGLILGIIFILMNYDFSSFFNDASAIKNYVLSFGTLSPLVFILIQSFQVLAAPVPGQVMGFASGYIFGWGLGVIYASIGLAIGSFFAFFLSRKYGRPFVEKFVKKDVLEKYDKKVALHGAVTLFFIFLIPGFPDDAVCFIAGLSKLRIKTMMLISVLGRLPSYLVMSLIGDGVLFDNFFSTIVLGLICLISVILFFEREKIENYLVRVYNSFKKIQVGSD